MRQGNSGIRRHVASMLIILVLAAMTQAATYYVAPQGNDSNPGTIQAPLQSPSAALRQAKPGDTIVFRAGRYPPFDVRNLSGTPQASITVKAQSGERVTIDRNLVSGPAVHACIAIGSGAKYLVFDGFELTNANPEIDALRPMNLRNPDEFARFKPYADKSEKDGRIHCNGVRMSSSANAPIHHIVFKNMEIHHFLGIGFSGGGDDLEFLNNHIYDLGIPRSGYGWYSSGDRHVYRGNVVHDCVYGFHLFNQSGERPLRDSVIECNIIYNNGRHPYYHMNSAKVKPAGVGLLVSPGENNIIRNNVVVNNAGGIDVNSNNSKVLNNTVCGNSVGIRVRGDKVAVQNNIFHANNKAINDAGSGTVLSHNLGGDGAAVKDPLFVNPAARDFHLKVGSPAIDKGVALSDVPTDFSGVVRPQGAAYDCGAYEYKP